MELSSEYLSTRITLEQAIQENMHEGVPFGHCADDWQRLLRKRKDGDEFWYFEPPNNSVMQLWGVALVRDGEVIATVLTGIG